MTQPAPRVLLVDDSDDDCFLAKRALQRGIPGVEITVAIDGVAALERLRSESYDLMLLDINMPRMTGIELLDAWAGHGAPTLPVVVMLTSSFEDRDRDATSKYDCVQRYLTKPITIETAAELRDLIVAGRQL